MFSVQTKPLLQGLWHNKSMQVRLVALKKKKDKFLGAQGSLCSFLVCFVSDGDLTTSVYELETITVCIFYLLVRENPARC